MHASHWLSASGSSRQGKQSSARSTERDEDKVAHKVADGPQACQEAGTPGGPVENKKGHHGTSPERVAVLVQARDAEKCAAAHCLSSEATHDQNQCRLLLALVCWENLLPQ